jgi:hypothetical protein
MNNRKILKLSGGIKIFMLCLLAVVLFFYSTPSLQRRSACPCRGGELGRTAKRNRSIPRRTERRTQVVHRL